MTSSPRSPPGTPSRAVSEDLSPLPRNPMADADSSVKRKRPRLDSGDRAYRSMSADPSFPAAGSSSQQGRIPPDSDEEDSVTLISNIEPEEGGESLPSRHLDRTPSKVTINVRDSSLASSPIQSLPTENPTTQAPEDSPEGNKMKLSDEINSSPPAENNAPSSETGSPQIEVAEPEDIDGHNGPTLWLPAEHHLAQDAESYQDMLLNELPGLKDESSHAECLQLINTILRKGISLFLILSHQNVGSFELADSHSDSIRRSEYALGDFSRWVNNYLEQTAGSPLSWYKMYVAAKDFWYPVPRLAEIVFQVTCVVLSFSC